MRELHTLQFPMAQTTQDVTLEFALKNQSIEMTWLKINESDHHWLRNLDKSEILLMKIVVISALVVSNLFKLVIFRVIARQGLTTINFITFVAECIKLVGHNWILIGNYMVAVLEQPLFEYTGNRASLLYV